MKRMNFLLATLAAASIPVFALAGQQPALTNRGSQFLLRGDPLQIISGEMHYARVPRADWRMRFRMAKAMGLNTISTYVFWNLHEPTPGHFDFSGEHDIATYIRTAKEEGLNVILRPGPYVCAEWELGGYPAWLLKDSTMLLRSTQPAFTEAAGRWLDRLGVELKPLLSSHGGPIIAVQVENEYGSFDKDKNYLAWQRDALHHAGFDDVRLYTADGDVQLKDGTLPDLPAVVNFGTGDADSSFARLARFKPGEPLMSGEYWAGWFDQWGGKHAQTDAGRQTSELEWMLSRGYSVNLYMFHGGTTPGFMNGANIDGGRYHPQTNSYDYDAPLDESGRPTAKYFAFRSVIAKYTHQSPPAVPEMDSIGTIASFGMEPVATLWSTLASPVITERPRAMETFDQSYGYMVYRNVAPASGVQLLAIHDVRDYAQVYVDNTLVATLDRRLGRDTVTITIPKAGSRLDILVANGGRVNFSRPLRTERKGITKSVTLGGRELLNWSVFPLPMATAPQPRSAELRAGAPTFYRGSFTVRKPTDTYLDLRGWGKGSIWVNGHQLGQFWDIGPQLSTFVPAAWQKSGKNEVVIFDLVAPAQRTLTGVSAPIWK